MYEDAFISWLITVESDVEEARADIEDRFDQLLIRLKLDDEDEKIPFLKEFLFTDFDPL